jgi:hypothetical protein
VWSVSLAGFFPRIRRLSFHLKETSSVKRLLAITVLCILGLLQWGVCFGADAPSAERARFDSFFSAIAETNLQSFAPQTLSDDAMLTFAQWNVAYHGAKSLKKIHNGMDVLAPSTLIDTITEQYFGKKISKHPAAQYTVSLATGEVDVFALVDNIRQLENGQIEAGGTIYYVRSGTKLDRRAGPSAWKKQGLTVRSSGTFTGILQPIASGSGEYTLLEYRLKETP